jgi:hypothetical protein
VYGDEGHLGVVVGVVGAVTLGVNISIKHHGELTLKCKFALCICVVARIWETFDTIARQRLIMTVSSEKMKKRFVKYMCTFWFQTIRVQRISVFKSALRTSNNCESWNAKFQGQMGSNPAFYKFITTLNNLILANDIDIERMENWCLSAETEKIEG